MRKRECIAMLLAGGQGSRLGGLTTNIAKPAVVFGGKYRMIDFTLSNCSNSHIDVVGVLTQYRPLMLNSYIGTGSAWALDSVDGGVTILPPYQSREGFNWYNNTAAAVYQNIEFIDFYNPDYVLILSGDHIYKMDYSKMLAYHKMKGADVTISVYPVPWEEANRFGIMVCDEDGQVQRFEEKPKEPISNLASMGIYIFNWKYLKDALIRDHDDPDSVNDFGKNIIPKALAEGRSLYAYSFNGYWKDAGTIPSYYEASMELLDGTCNLDLDDPSFPVYSKNQVTKPQYIGREAHVTDCYVCDGCTVLGEAVHSVISNDVYIGRDAKVYDSIILHGARIEDSAEVYNAIIDENVVITRGRQIGRPDAQPGQDISVVSLSDGAIQ
jgi:glucose-1-phosphate adenylyltransferase